MTYKLGKRTPSRKVSVKFADFLKALPTAPLIDIAPNYVYPMDGNDVWGDCACADEAHSQQVVSGLLTGTQIIPTIQQIETWYQTQNPTWNPTSGQEGNGMDIQTFLEYLTSQNLIVGFAEIDYTNTTLLQAAIYLGLAVKVGVQLQQAQMDQFASGLWDFVEGSPIIGGHDICFVGYNATTKLYSLISWGQLIQCTQAFVDNLADEAWFPIRPEHVAHPGFRDHFDYEGFTQAVAQISGGQISIPTGAVTVSTVGLNLIESFEGFSSTPYQDAGGKWAIGYGFDYLGNPQVPVTANTPPITQQEAQGELLMLCSTIYTSGVLNALTVPINQGQLDALTSFAYNLGVECFAKSSICSKINAEQHVVVQDFTQYDNVNGVPNDGLLERRETEYILFATGQVPTGRNYH